MGESVFEGTLTKWLKKVGDKVVRDEPLFEISTDKVDSEIPSPASGILSAIIVPEGKTVQVNAVLATIDESGTAEVRAPAPAAKEKNDSDAAPPPEKAAAPSPILPPKDLPAAPSRQIPAQRTPLPSATAPEGTKPLDIRTSPLVRRLARENNVDLSKVRGTGLEGRITKDDLLAYLEKAASPAASPPQPRAEKEPAGDSRGYSAIRFAGESEIVPMSAMRKAIAEHMVLSKRTSAHVNTVFEVDVSSVVQMHNAHKREFEEREGIPLTYTPFFAKALIDNVREFPVFNTSVVGEDIVYKKPINLGIAVALETGLIVPVVKDAHLKSFTGLALGIHDLAERARTKRLKPDDVQNGTISITNPGSYGALFATPVISQPQVAILGVGGIEKRPVVINDAIAIRSMVCLSLTFDHRVIDGSVADRFMARLKARLQSWTQWID
jgi:2-oxoglutarate dehydrogenase E2 component (dihydrolipoamide succinyltransferase)